MATSNATIHNVRLDSHFTITSNATPEDPNLSWAAKGLLWYILSRSHDWKIFTSQLSEIYQGKERGNGYDAIKKIVKELRNAGYVKYTKSKDSKGKWQHRYDVYPIPHSDFQKIYPEVVKPPVVQPAVVKPPIIPSTYLTKNDDVVNAHAREEKSNPSDILITRDSKGRERTSCRIAIINYLSPLYQSEIIEEALKIAENCPDPISNPLKYVEVTCINLKSQNDRKPLKQKEETWKKKNKFKEKSKHMDANHLKKLSLSSNEIISDLGMSERPLANWRSLMA